MSETLAPNVSHCTSEAIEINCAWHCNLRCIGCSHGSPHMQARFPEPRRVALSLSLLSQWLRVDHVRLVGGEPLLNPSVADIIDAVKAAYITSRIRLITNGILLSRSEELWNLIDEMHISVYPGTRLFFKRTLPMVRELAFSTRTVVIVKYFDYFRVAYRPKSSDAELTELIYRTCQIANLWRCLTVENGYLYRCPQSAVHDFLIPGGSKNDRLWIDSITSRESIHRWINGSTPLSACRSCCGSAGIRLLHRQQSDGNPRTEEAPSGDELVDQAFLEALEANPWLENGCVVSEEVIR